jgi:hypothetical protein
VGSYGITLSDSLGTGAAGSNYTVTYGPNATLTVSKANLTISTSDATRLYGQTDPTFQVSYNGLVAGDTSSVVSGLVINSGTNTATPIGTYGIGDGNPVAANYHIIYSGGDLTIDPAPLTITPNNASKVYGTTGSYAASYVGLVAGDTSSVVTGLAYTSAGTTTTAGVGSYSVAANSATASNYAITYGPNATLTVTPASLTVTANNASRLYDTTDPTFSASYAGLVAGDTSSVVSGLALGTTATLTSPIGSYTITGGNPVAANYTVTYVPGTFSIVAGYLTITANDATRLYGGTNPTFTASYTGLVGNDTVTGLEFSTTAVSTSGVGTYVITPYGATSTNYTISYVTGTLSVTPAPLIVTANNASRTTTQPDPVFTATFTGLVNNDLPNVVGGLTFLATDPANAGAGTYQIIPGNGYAANYTLYYQPGVLTVVNAPSPSNGTGQTNSYISSVVTASISSFSVPVGAGNTSSSLQTLVNLLGTEGTLSSPEGVGDNTECIKGNKTDEDKKGKECTSTLTIRGF